MSSDDDEDGPWICARCVGEIFLNREIARTGTVHACSYCETTGPAIAAEDLADWVEGAFETHYVRTSSEPDSLQRMMMSDRESTYDFERDGDPVLWAVAGAAEVSEAIAEALLEILGDRHSDFDSAAMGEECEFEGDSYYARRGPNDIELQLEWKELERSLKSETRFFNKAAEAQLKRVFRGIESYRAAGGRRVIRVAGPGRSLKSFYRARVFHDGGRLEEALIRPDLGLGPPPTAVAPGGRMNARGVSLFYGATHPDAALAEVRPPVGSRTLVGRFDVIRPLRLLDVEALRSVYVEGSIFDPGYMGRLELARFLERVSERMTMPVMPDDEPSEYLVTQVIADYLANDPDLNLDGLLYPSVQQSGRHQNVVLFRRASLVASLELPPGGKVRVQLDERDGDDFVPHYWVSETVPEPKPVAKPDENDGGLVPLLRPTRWGPFDEPSDDREPALSVATDTLHVHHVEGVKIKTLPFKVGRHRYNARA